jgi:hypothetical protein
MVARCGRACIRLAEDAQPDPVGQREVVGIQIGRDRRTVIDDD